MNLIQLGILNPFFRPLKYLSINFSSFCFRALRLQKLRIDCFFPSLKLVQPIFLTLRLVQIDFLLIL